MEQEKDYLVQTSDGSTTVYSAVAGQTYHSRRGAILESMHVFIGQGMSAFRNSMQGVNILEVGFGTGLNALLTAREVRNGFPPVNYTTIELFPLSPEVYNLLHFPGDGLDSSAIRAVHTSPWNEDLQIWPGFTLHKVHADIRNWNFPKDLFDIVYYDAFSPGTQPYMWTPALFTKMFDAMRPGGVLVTYCCQGQVRRDLLACGFRVEKCPGPPGKREMIRASKPEDHG